MVVWRWFDVRSFASTLDWVMCEEIFFLLSLSSPLADVFMSESLVLQNEIPKFCKIGTTTLKKCRILRVSASFAKLRAKRDQGEMSEHNIIIVNKNLKKHLLFVPTHSIKWKIYIEYFVIIESCSAILIEALVVSCSIVWNIIWNILMSSYVNCVIIAWPFELVLVTRTNALK